MSLRIYTDRSKVIKDLLGRSKPPKWRIPNLIPMDLCLALRRWLPVWIMWTLIVMLYLVYVFVIQPRALVNAIFQLHFLFLVVSYLRVIFTSPGYAIPGLVDEDECDPASPEHRWCDLCDLPKVEGIHHCSHCGHCIQFMDHHCVFINNCVGLRNHKYFLLTLWYATLTCGQMVIGSTTRLWTKDGASSSEEYSPWREGLSRAMWVLALVLGLVVGLFLSFHLYLIRHNITTLDFIASREGRPSPHPHLRRICGETPYIGLWLVPCIAPTTSSYTSVDQEDVQQNKSIPFKNAQT